MMEDATKKRKIVCFDNLIQPYSGSVVLLVAPVCRPVWRYGCHSGTMYWLCVRELVLIKCYRRNMIHDVHYVYAIQMRRVRYYDMKLASVPYSWYTYTHTVHSITAAAAGDVSALLYYFIILLFFLYFCLHSTYEGKGWLHRFSYSNEK